MRAGLRVDVDTLRGTRLGVPRLLDTLGKFGVRGTFFFSVGPDNMGRHLWRLFRPAFLWKMLRTRAPSLYGWDILRCGVIGNGPDIGLACADIIRRAEGEGHEIGLHAWDHQRWQTMDLFDPNVTARELDFGLARLTEIIGRAVRCSAAPAWRATPEVVALKRHFHFAYNSDCRGTDCFLPGCGAESPQPQIPVTLPTYDEIIGSGGVTEENYNRHLLDLFRPGALNVLCVHAEVEGIAKAGLFESFLAEAAKRGVSFAPLAEILREQGELRRAAVEAKTLPGREGFVCSQGGWLT